MLRRDGAYQNSTSNCSRRKNTLSLCTKCLRVRLVNKEGIVAIQDDVRPLVSKITIVNCFNVAEQYGNAIPVVDVVDSLRHVKKNREQSSKTVVLQNCTNPKVFPNNSHKKAYQQEFTDAFTDDASVVEAAGTKIHLVSGNKENIKITSPEDLIVAMAFIAAAK
ncbi:MAG: 2-C-methyl-D-erythritol 4-phosphate cytidylyltransferase [Vicingaceae bacterium]|nr:2-C-methyl-D-erythritol 4-phosphate cytidylyltransferase [Vicingaceae bacterium]